MIPNLGVAGSAIDATVYGLTQVDGPAIWFPGTAGNNLEADGYTIPSTLGTLTLPFTDADLTITAADIAATHPADDIFIASTGQPVTVNRGDLAFPVTTIVTAGRVYVNTDPADLTQTIDTPTNTVYDLNDSDDFVLCWCGQVGRPLRSLEVLEINALDNTSTINISADGNVGISTGTAIDSGGNNVNGELSVTPYDYTCLTVRLDRAANTLTVDAYTWDGHTGTQTVDATTLGTFTTTTVTRTLWQTPSVLSSFAWNKGVAVAPDDATMGDIADWFLSLTLPATPLDPSVLLVDDTGAVLTDDTGTILKG